MLHTPDQVAELMAAPGRVREIRTRSGATFVANEYAEIVLVQTGQVVILHGDGYTVVPVDAIESVRVEIMPMLEAKPDAE